MDDKALVPDTLLVLEEIDLMGEGVKGVITPSVKPLPHQIAEEKPLPESERLETRHLEGHTLLNEGGLNALIRCFDI